jgi:hypothetical protein
MENLTHETYLADFAVREKIEREARRAQTEAVRRYILAPLARAIARLIARATHPDRARGVAARALERS